MTQIYHEPLPAALMYDKNEAELAPKNNKGKKCLGGMLILKVIQAILQRIKSNWKMASGIFRAEIDCRNDNTKNESGKH